MKKYLKPTSLLLLAATAFMIPSVWAVLHDNTDHTWRYINAYDQFGTILDPTTITVPCLTEVTLAELTTSVPGGFEAFYTPEFGALYNFDPTQSSTTTLSFRWKVSTDGGVNYFIRGSFTVRPSSSTTNIRLPIYVGHPYNTASDQSFWISAKTGSFTIRMTAFAGGCTAGDTYVALVEQRYLSLTSIQRDIP